MIASKRITFALSGSTSASAHSKSIKALSSYKYGIQLDRSGTERSRMHTTRAPMASSSSSIWQTVKVFLASQSGWTRSRSTRAVTSKSWSSLIKWMMMRIYRWRTRKSNNSSSSTRRSPSSRQVPSMGPTSTTPSLNLQRNSSSKKTKMEEVPMIANALWALLLRNSKCKKEINQQRHPHTRAAAASESLLREEETRVTSGLKGHYETKLSFLVILLS